MKPAPAHIAIVEVDFDVLATALGLPIDAKIIGVREGYTFSRLEIKVEHKDLPAVFPGCVLTKVIPETKGGRPSKFVQWK